MTTVGAVTASTAAPAALRRAAAVRGWLAAGTVYGGGVLNRTSLGIASIAATHRFGLSPAQLSVFVILQLGIYAAMQIPTGLLVDRFGSRRMLLTASSVMGVAGLTFAFAPNYPVALLGRALLGCGDAMTYISVLRFAGANFSRRRFPQVVALTGLFGFTATILATVPLALLLHFAGWEATFTIIALVPLVGGVAAGLAVPAEDPARKTARPTRAETLAAVRFVWRTPGTRLGFWIHFSAMSMANAFASLWGLPYLVAMGFTKSRAGYVLLLCVLVGIVVSLSAGVALVRRPHLRVPISVASCVVTVLTWIGLLTFGGDHPNKALVIVLVAVMAVGGPVSSIGFLLARDYNRPANGGTATGVTNVAGFVATISCAGVIGGVLSIAGNTGPGAFRLAFLAALAIPAFGTFRMVVWWRRSRADVLKRAEAGQSVPVLVVRRPWDARLASSEVGPEAAPADSGSIDLADLAQ